MRILVIVALLASPVFGQDGDPDQQPESVDESKLSVSELRGLLAQERARSNRLALQIKGLRRQIDVLSQSPEGKDKAIVQLQQRVGSQFRKLQRVQKANSGLFRKYSEADQLMHRATNMLYHFLSKYDVKLSEDDEIMARSFRLSNKKFKDGDPRKGEAERRKELEATLLEAFDKKMEEDEKLIDTAKESKNKANPRRDK